MNVQLLIKQVDEILKADEKITLLANFSALLYQSFDNLNWLGFYIFKDGILKLGPFQGKVACEKIPLDKGVCGYAARNLKIVNVMDVHEFKGHIACDSASQSELVLPIIVNGQFEGLLDIDAPIKNRFDKETEDFFKEAVNRLSKRYQEFASPSLL